jgi:hypothetical protein
MPRFYQTFGGREAEKQAPSGHVRGRPTVTFLRHNPGPTVTRLTSAPFWRTFRIVDAPGPKGPPAVSVSEKPESPASGAIIKRPKRARKTAEEKRLGALQMIEWATDISGKHPNLINDFLTSKDDRLRFEAWRVVTSYRFGLPTGRVEVDLKAAARMLAASRGISEKALLDRAARIVDAVTTVADEKPVAAAKAGAGSVVVAEPEE